MTIPNVTSAVDVVAAQTLKHDAVATVEQLDALTLRVVQKARGFSKESSKVRWNWWASCSTAYRLCASRHFRRCDRGGPAPGQIGRHS
jgi:hypothetical protein